MTNNTDLSIVTPSPSPSGAARLARFGRALGPLGRALAELTALDGVREAVILSTCNRTEFYVIADDEGRSQLRRCILHRHMTRAKTG